MKNNERDNINTNVIMYNKKDKIDGSVGYIEVFYKNNSVHKEPIYVR